MSTLLFTDDSQCQLAPLDQRLPSSLLPMAGKNRLVYWLEHCYRTNLRDITFVSPQAEQLKTQFGSGKRYGVSLNYCTEWQPLVDDSQKPINDAEIKAKPKSESNADEGLWLIDANSMVHFDLGIWAENPKTCTQFDIDQAPFAAFVPKKEIRQCPAIKNFSALIQILQSKTHIQHKTVEGQRLKFDSIQAFHQHTLDILEGKYPSLVPAGVHNAHEPRMRVNGQAKWHENSLKVGQVYCGNGTQIHKSAQIRGSCSIEDDCHIDREVRLSRAIVLNSSYVGAMTELNDCIVWGRLLIRVDTGAVIEMADDIILADQSTRIANRSWGQKLGALVGR